MITVFTPTYNRAYCIKQLYDSLCCQTCSDFEWLVVDDGSSDNTKELFDSWIKEEKISIRYYKIENGGKANAISYGLEKANKKMFFVVDSDDYLSNDAVEKIISEEKLIQDREHSAGLVFRRGHYDGSLIGPKYSGMETELSSLDIAYKYGLVCDKAEVFYTDILKRFPFPKNSGCKFYPEGLVVYRIARAGYLLRLKDDIIYYCEYLQDGYTQNFKACLKKNAVGFAPYYRELFRTKGLPLIVYVKSAIRYLQCKFYLGIKKYE